MILISHINKLFILLLLSIGATSPSYSGLFDDWTDNQLCEWMDQPSPPGIIKNLVIKKRIHCSEGIAVIKVPIVPSNAFDGNYTFKLFADPPSMGKNQIGGGILEIQGGIVSIAAAERRLVVSSKNKYFNSFEGQINKNGKVEAYFLLNPCGPGQCGGDKNFSVEGNINELELNGEFILGSGPDIVKIIFELKDVATITTSTTKTDETTSVATSDDDPTVSKVIEVIQGDKFIVDIAEPHELAGSNIKLNLRGIDAPDAKKSCPKQMEVGIKVKDFVTQKLANASSIKLTNFKKTSAAVIAHVIVDGNDLGDELISKGYASDDFGYWKPYFCSALSAMQAGDQYFLSDFEKSMFWYERTLVLDPNSSNKSRIIYQLSVLYSMTGDYDKSLDYLKQSASLGWMQAEEGLGIAYLTGDGVAKDTSKAKSWLKKAHEHGSGKAEEIYCSSLPVAKQNTCKF